MGPQRRAGCRRPRSRKDASTPQLSANVTAATDYIFRGVSQTQNDPAIVGSARLAIGRLYAGAGISRREAGRSG